MKNRQLRDQGDRTLIREDLDATVLVEAAAGTGKTTELVERILNVIASGRATIDQIVAVTFTEKAAGELKIRIRQELETRRQTSSDDHAHERLTAAIQRLEEAHVSTIHGFCADLLRERPVEAGVDPLFDVLTEARAGRIYEEAFRGWLHQQLEDPPEGIHRALRRSVWSRDGRDRDDGPVERLSRAGWSLVEWRDFTGPWRRDPFDRDRELGAVLARVHDLADLTGKTASTRDLLYLDTVAVRDLSHDIRTAERFEAPDFDGWEARVIDLAQNKVLRRAHRGRGSAYGPGVTRDVVWAAYEVALAAIDLFQRAADADLAVLLHDELAEVVVRYETLKRRAGALDFVDLLLSARNMLVAHAGVRRAFQQRFTRIFVDEFQDTDPLQAEILLLLSADDPGARDWRAITPSPGKLFIVGDPKQAIYRFRRADVATYQEVCDLLAKRGAKRAYLHTSFRATPTIQHAVNAAFRPQMTGDRETLQAEYVDLSPYRDDNSQPSLVVLPVPDPYGQRRVAGYQIEKSQPDAVGAFVHWLIEESGWTVTERTTREELPMRVPVQARHVCILFRRFLHFGADVTRDYVEALEARGVPHLLVGGKSFHDREEVDTMRAALAAVEWPDDELSVFATLRGALFAMNDETLLEYRHAQKVFHPYRILQNPSAELAPVCAALALLRTLHARRNYRPVADTVTEILDATRAHVGFALRHVGEQALANVLHVAELARQYEADGGISFRGFVEELADQADGGQAAEAPVLEERSDGVRLMTVHKAKGLEFPVVVLADMTAKLRSERADRLIDRDRHACYMRLGRWTPIELALDELREVARDEAEGVRVAYVAATRARDLLVVPGVGDVAWDGGWTEPLNGAVYPAAGARQSAVAAPGCPVFTKDSVRSRPDNDPSTPMTVRPGLHLMSPPDAEPFQVVWWDPHALKLDAEPTAGIRREGLIVKDVPDAVIAEGLREYERWRLTREQAIASGGMPSMSIRTATEWVSEPRPSGGVEQGVSPAQAGLFEARTSTDAAGEASENTGLSVEIVDARHAHRVGGIRLGRLVHAVLAAAPLDAGADAVSALAEVHGRILAAPDEEVSACATTVAHVLAHPVLARARDAAQRDLCRREVPVACRMPDGTIVEGAVDLAFEEDGVWTIVDYKTDREIASAGEDRYRRQIALYAMAIAQATGKRATGVLLRI